MSEKTIDFRIVKHIATLGVNKHNTLELNKVSFNGYPEKWDLRRWATGYDGERIPLKGLQLNDAEFEMLKSTLFDAQFEGLREELAGMNTDKPKEGKQ